MRVENLRGVDAQGMVESCAHAHWLKSAVRFCFDTVAPSFLVGAVTQERAERDYQSRQLTVPEAGCLVVENAFAYDYGLVVKDDLILFDKTISVGAEDIGAWGFFTGVSRRGDETFDIKPPRVHERSLGKAILLGRRGDTVHGHWLLEALPRFLAATRHNSGKARIIVSSYIARYQTEMLVALGACEEDLYRLSPGEAVLCEELWAPSVAHSNELWLHPFANDTYRALIKAVGLEPSSILATERLFITRASRAEDPRSVINCAELERIARRLGFRIVDPGSISWRDQVDLFARAGKVAGLSGSGLHNTAFTSASAHVCVLQPNQNNNFLQSSIATIRGHRISYLIGESFSPFDRVTWQTPYVIDPALFELFLDHLL